MLALDRAGADDDVRTRGRRDAEMVQPGAGAHDVDDGVVGADFVEVYLLDGSVVNGGFGFGQALEDLLGLIAHQRREVGGVDDLGDMRQVPMLARGFIADFDGRLRRGDALLLDPLG